MMQDPTPATDPDPWNDFVASSPYGDVLQCRQWGELKARTGWEPLHLSVDGPDGIRAAALVLKRAIPRTRKCIFYCPRGPVVDYADAEALQALFDRIRQAAREHGALVFKMDPAVPADAEDVTAALRAQGLRPARDAGGFGGVQPRAVMKVDLTPEPEELLAGFHNKWRYNIRLGARKGVVVRADCTGAQEMDVFYDLLLVTARRDGFRVRAREYFHHIRELILEQGLGALFMAHVDGTPVSGAIAFALGHQCWYVYGASDNEHRKLMPNHIMQWEMMRWARERGCTVYDMRGVSPEVDGEPVDEHLAGLNRFKKGFGAQYVEYGGDWDLVFNPLWYALFQRALPYVRRRAGAEEGE